MSGLTAVLIARDKARLIELQTVYSYEDALNLAEIIAVQNYNEWLAMESSKNG